ncbi:MAG: hypothetical protein PHQ05_05840 [Sterolibacterium sp.]|nr:hypothetical protein [Sterolibacterium sp.]
MESINSNSATSLAARIQDFTQSAKREREEKQQAADKAAKVERPTAIQHVNQVSFSQEAQIKLSQEMSQDANRVQEVRVADNAKAAEEYSRALRQEADKRTQSRIEAGKARVEKDKVEETRSNAALKFAREGKRIAEESAAADKMQREDARAKALSEHSKALRDADLRTQAIVVARGLERESLEKARLDEKMRNDETVKNIAFTRKVNEDAGVRMRENKAANEQDRVKAAKALKMYNKIYQMA